MHFRIFIALLMLTSCTSENRKTTNQIKGYEPTSVHKKNETPLDSLNKWVKKDLEVQEIKVTGDTLKLISEDFYFYYPFGKYKYIDSIRLKYPLFKFNLEIDTTQGQKDKLYRMVYKDSFVKFAKSDETGRIEIVYARILDNNIVALRGLRVGLTKDVFFEKLFDRSVKLDKINNVKIISALDGIWHYYHFNRDTISSIILNTDYTYYKY